MRVFQSRFKIVEYFGGMSAKELFEYINYNFPEYSFNHIYQINDILKNLNIDMYIYRDNIINKFIRTEKPFNIPNNTKEITKKIINKLESL